MLVRRQTSLLKYWDRYVIIRLASVELLLDPRLSFVDQSRHLLLLIKNELYSTHKIFTEVLIQLIIYGSIFIPDIVLDGSRRVIKSRHGKVYSILPSNDHLKIHSNVNYSLTTMSSRSRKVSKELVR